MLATLRLALPMDLRSFFCRAGPTTFTVTSMLRRYWHQPVTDGRSPISMNRTSRLSPVFSSDFRGEQNDNKRKSIGASLERSRLALERWQGLCRRWLLPQRADGSGSRPDEGGLRNHLRQPQRQHAANGCQFSHSPVLRWGRGYASGLS